MNRMCLNQLTWVPPSHQQISYYVPLCDELYRTPKDETDGATAWYYDENGQCMRCPREAKRDLIVLVAVLVVGGPLAFLGGKMLIDPDLAPIASPIISVVFLFQIACQFDDAIAGGLWPPLIQAAFDMHVWPPLERNASAQTRAPPARTLRCG